MTNIQQFNKFSTKLKWVTDAKWITNKGQLSKRGEIIANSKWDDLSDSARDVLRRFIGEDYPNTVENQATPIKEQTENKVIPETKKIEEVQDKAEEIIADIKDAIS